MKSRAFKDSNYKAIFCNGKTFRFPLDPSKPILSTEYPEFSDIKITNKCHGNCPYCYMDSSYKFDHPKGLLRRVRDFYEPLTPNQRPFQVAIGGGEPTLHPDFPALLELLDSLGIVPNYTTNGMFVNHSTQQEWERIMYATEQYSGGVAVSCHEHLDEHWQDAATEFIDFQIKLNFHIIISDKKSIDRFNKIYRMYFKEVDYFVLLPYQSMGRAEQKDIDYEYLKETAPSDTSKIAFGADFYKYLVDDPGRFKVSLYEPEAFSAFIDFTQEPVKIYRSSFDLTEK